MDENCVRLFFQLHEFAVEFLQMPLVQFISMTDADSERCIRFQEKCRNLLHHFAQTPGDAFFSHKLVLVGKGLDLGPVDKQRISGEFTVVTQPYSLLKSILSTPPRTSQTGLSLGIENSISMGKWSCKTVPNFV